MASINVHAFGISSRPLKSDSDRSLPTVYGFTSLPQQHRGVQNSALPLVVKSMKFVQQRQEEPTLSSERPVFQTWLMSTLDFMVKTVGTSESKKGVISAAPEIGVAVFILKDDKVLLGRRRSLHIGGYTYGLPGGHLEFGESFEECAAREVKEETGLDIKNIEFLTATSNCLSDSVHAVAIYMRAHLSDPHQTPKNLEPNKCEGWNWYDLKALPEPTFGPLREMLKGGFNPFPNDV